MITLKELIKDVKLDSLDIQIQWNIQLLLAKINKIRELYVKPMSITSGLRTKEDHLRIYKEKALKEGITFDLSKVPMASQHLVGAAVDIGDPKKDLQHWCLMNQDHLVSLQLWMEDFKATPTWCHFQIVAPKSGKLFFSP